MTITWTNNAQKSYSYIIDFLLERWEIKVAEDFELRVSVILERLKSNQHLCPPTNFKSLRKCVIHKNASIIYLVKEHALYIVDVIDNRCDNPY